MGNSNSKGGFSSDKFLAEIHRTDSDFRLEKSRVFLKEKNTTGFIAFYAPWCHFCVDLAPRWNSYANEMKNSSFKFLAVDCTSDDSKQVAEKLNINGFPTIKFIDAKTGEIIDAKYDDNTPLDRSPEGIKRFLKEKKFFN